MSELGFESPSQPGAHGHPGTLIPDPSLPADVDECVEGTIQCGSSQMCFNTRGGAQCMDVPCPAGYRRGSSPG